MRKTYHEKKGKKSKIYHRPSTKATTRDKKASQSMHLGSSEVPFTQNPLDLSSSEPIRHSSHTRPPALALRTTAMMSVGDC